MSIGPNVLIRGDVISVLRSLQNHVVGNFTHQFNFVRSGNPQHHAGVCSGKHFEQLIYLFLVGLIQRHDS